MTLTADELVKAADLEVGHITVDEARALVGDPSVRFIDVRDVRELAQTGRVPGAKHCPRGMLEFWIDPQSPYYKPVFGEDVRFVFYCAAGWRSALSAQTAKHMGLERVTHMQGGMGAWLDAGAPTEQQASKTETGS